MGKVLHRLKLVNDIESPSLEKLALRGNAKTVLTVFDQKNSKTFGRVKGLPYRYACLSAIKLLAMNNIFKKRC